MDEYQRLFVQERLGLGALLAELEPDEWGAATLDEGWTVEDLAAHIVVRERRGAAMTLALVGRGRFGSVDELMEREKARGREALLAALRAMPPLFFRLPGLVARGNLGEAYIHHEDVRRGALNRPRVPGEDLQAALWTALPIFTVRGPRRLPVRGLLTLEWPGQSRRHVVLGGGRRVNLAQPSATLRGTPGELLLWMTGRKAAARVDLDGAPEIVAALRDADMGI